MWKTLIVFQNQLIAKVPKYLTGHHHHVDFSKPEEITKRNERLRKIKEGELFSYQLY